MTDLAGRQADLVRALVAGGPVPDGFDADRVRVTAASLLNKRRSVAARLRPDLVERLGGEFRARFDEWAVRSPRQAGTSFRADLAEFENWLDSHP